MSNNEIEKRLWEAADQLRANSGLKYSQFARPILGLIFLRYADYKFNQAQKELIRASKTKPEKGTMDVYIPRRKKVSPSDYQSKGVIFLPENAQYSYILNLPESKNIGKALYDAMKAIEDENDDLKGVLDIEYSEIEDSVLIALLKLFSKIDFQYNDDIFGKIYEYFLGKFAMGEGQRGGEFFTPESLVKLIVEVIEPIKGRIYDPACGSGGMFVHSTNYVKRKNKDPMNEIAVYGQEKSSETVKLCKMNLAVHGITGDIKQANTYYEDLHESLNKFDFVISNPPFNVNGVNKQKIKTDKRYTYGIPTIDNANYLWIQIFLNSLNENGKAGFVMTNTTNEAIQSELEIRKKIINEDYVNIIISIGTKFFYNVSLACTLWFFDKNKKNPKKTLFLYANNIFHEEDRAHNVFLPEQIEFIANIVRLYNGDELEFTCNSQKMIKEKFPNFKYRDLKGLCKVVDTDEIRKKNYSLNPGRFVGIKIEIQEDKDFYKEIESYYKKYNDLKIEEKDNEQKIIENFKFLMKNRTDEK